MAINPGGGGRQIRVEVLFDVNQATLRQVATAIETAGVLPLRQVGLAAGQATSAQQRLQESFGRSIQSLRTWELQVGRSEETVRRFIGTFEGFMRRGLVLTPEQGRTFEALQRQAAGYAQVRKAGSDIVVEAARREEQAYQRLQQRLIEINRLRQMGVQPLVTVPLEQRAFRQAVSAGVSRPEVLAGQEAAEAQARRLGIATRDLTQGLNVRRVIEWGLAWQATYGALNLVTGLITGSTIGAIQRLANFQERTIALAAELVNLNPSLPFSAAMRASDGLLESLTRLQPAFIGTQTQLQEILTATLRYFGAVDLQSERGRQSFLAFANGIALSQIGINRAGSAFREVAALIEGVIRPGAQFLTLLSKIDPQIEQHIALWRREGTVVENIAKLLPGFEQAAAAIGESISGQLRTLESNIDRILRRGAPGGLVSNILRGLNVATENPQIGAFALDVALSGALLLAGRNLGPRLLQAIFRGMSESRAQAIIGGGAPIAIGVLLGNVLEPILARRVAELFAGGTIQNRIRQFIRPPDIEAPPLIRRTPQSEELLIRGTLAGLARDAEERLANVSESFRRGEVSVKSYRDALLEVAEAQRRRIGQAADTEAAEKEAKAYRDRVRAIEQFDAELKKLERDRPLRNLQVLEQSIRLEQQLTDSIAFRGRLLLDQLKIQEKQEEIRRQRAGELFRAEVDPRVIEEANERIREIRAAILRTEREITLNQREQVDLIRQAREAQFRAAGLDISAQLLSLERQREDEVRQAQGNRALLLEVERRFVFERFRLLKDAADRLRDLEADLARARLSALEGPSGLRQERLRFDITGLQPTGAEGEGEIRRRFQRIRELTRQQQDEALRVTRARASDIRLPLEEQVEARGRLFRLILEQTRAQAELNRQEADAIRNARERDLATEITLLERRVQLLQRVGAPAEQVTAAGEQLQRARRLQELRGLPQQALEQELAFSQRLLRQPDITREQFDATRRDIETIRTALDEGAQAQARQVELTQQQSRELKGLEESVQRINEEIAQRAAAAAKRARDEYDGLFSFVRRSLEDQVNLWRASGDASGRAFAEAARVHLERVFPGVGAPAPSVPVPDILRRSGTTINIGSLDITSALSEQTRNELVQAVLTTAGNRGVRAERRQIADSQVA